MTSSTRRAYINFQLGDGWEDISHLTKYNTFSVSTRAFNDTFHYAQNECQLDILYDATIWNNIISTRTPILLRILDLINEAVISTENNVIITAENAFALAVEQDIAFPVFYGHIAPETSWSYNGLTSNSIMSLTATDELDTLDVACGDILYANYAICDPMNPTASIVHALISVIGWDIAYVDPSVTISTVIPRFAPPDPESTVLEVLDTLLYEYGYTLNMSVSGQILPLKWNRSSTDPAEWEFTDANCIKEVTTRDSYKDYDGVSVTYYALKTAPKVLLYRDDNCGYADDGSFAGYNILAGTTYPPETNVIDETTGLPTVVYQEYDDTGIKYKTNKAITEGMDYNYKAFSSDFSAMVATENHFLDARISVGIVPAFTTEFYNTKCRVGWSNPTGDDGLKLYFNNVYADVWYKSTERKTTVDIVAEPLRSFSYTSNYIFEKTHGDNLAKGLAKQYLDRAQTHGVTSDDFFAVGSLVNLVLSDGTSQACLIMSCDFNESTGLYTYQLTRTSTVALDLTSQDNTDISVVVPTSPFVGLLTVGQINIPYVGSTPDYTNAYTNMLIKQDGLDVSSDWAYNAVPSGVTGTLSGNRYTITSISGTTGSVVLTASRANWDDIVVTLTVVKAVGEQGDPGANGNDGDNAVVMTSATAPSGTYTGQLGEYNSRIYRWNGSAWVLNDVAPKYLGISIPNATNNPLTTLYTVGYSSPNYIFVEGSAVTAKVGDWSFIRSFIGGTLDDTKALRIWDGSTWTGTGVTNYHRTTAAQDLMDTCKVYGTPTSGDSYEWFNSLVANQAFIDFLQVRNVKISSSGSIYGGERYNADGTNKTMSANGFWIGASGVQKSNGGSFSLTDTTNRTIDISPTTGLLAKDSNGVVIHDIFTGPVTTGHSYCGHLQYFTQGSTFKIYDVTNFNINTWTDVACLSGGNSNVKAGLFKVYLNSDNNDSGVIEAFNFVWLRPYGSTWGVGADVNTPEGRLYIEDRGSHLDSTSSVYHLICPIASNGYIQFYANAQPSGLNKRIVICQLGVYI